MQINKKYFTFEKLNFYLKAAIDQENPLAIKNLIQFAPDLLEQRIEGSSPLEYAVKEGKTKILNVLFPEGQTLKLEHDSPSRLKVEALDINHIRTTPPKSKISEISGYR